MDQLVTRIETTPADALELVEDMARIKVASRTSWAKLWGQISPTLADAGIDRRKLTLAVDEAAKALLAEQREIEIDEARSSAKRQGIPTFERGDNAEVAWVLHQELNTETTPIAYDYGKVWRYQPKTGHYVEISDAELSTRLQDWSGAPLIQGDKLRSLMINGTSTTIELLKDRLMHTTRPDFFAGAKPVVSFRNVTIVASSRVVVIDHGPHHRCDTHLDVEYQADARGELLEEYLSTVFAGEDDAADKRTLLQQVAGAAMFGLTTRIGKKAIMVAGGKGTGKSTFLHLVEALVPAERRSNIPPQRFGDDIHGVDLAGKRLNIVFETPEDDIMTEAGFKAIVHGEPIRRAQKYEKPIEFRPVATHVFAANALPSAPATTEAYWDRWAVCQFHRRFRDTDRQIHDLWEKIIAQEFGAVVAWAVQGAQLLLDHHDFILPPSSREALEEWAETRPIPRWARETILADADGFMTNEALLANFKSWATRNGHSQHMSTVTLGKRLRDLGYEPERTKSERGFKVRFAQTTPF